jgi:hypothetical protein
LVCLGLPATKVQGWNPRQALAELLELGTRLNDVAESDFGDTQPGQSPGTVTGDCLRSTRGRTRINCL